MSSLFDISGLSFLARDDLFGVMFTSVLSTMITCVDDNLIWSLQRLFNHRCCYHPVSWDPGFGGFIGLECRGFRTVSHEAS